MTDPIERALLAGFSNMLSYRPPNAKIAAVVYDSDMPKLVKDIRDVLERAERKPDVVAEDYHQGGA